MSCCGNNKIDQLKQIYTQPVNSSNPFNTNTNKPIVKSSPFSNTDYKPIMSPNGKFVKYVRELKKI